MPTLVAPVSTSPNLVSTAYSIEVAVLKGWSAVEDSLRQGALEKSWEDLLSQDSVATFYQTPLWCLTWYRCYQDAYEPLLLLGGPKDQLFGIAPLARERSTGRIIFAGDGMADYRDFVCHDRHREEITEHFLGHIKALSCGSCFVLGHTQPDSPTAKIAARWALRHGCQIILRTHPCWRFSCDSEKDVEILYKKKTIRQAFTYYKRQGSLNFRRLRTVDEWDSIKEAYYTQHCLRQAAAGREESFEDSRKQNLYSQLFESLSPDVHLSGLWLGDRPIAFSFSFTHHGMLYYGAPSFDIRETKHSPGMLHLIEMVKHCHQERYREVDLTLGSSSFKGRIGTHCVELPTIYVYPRRTQFWKASIRKVAADRVKGLLEQSASATKLHHYARHCINRLSFGVSRCRHLPSSEVIKRLVNLVSTFFYSHYRGEVFEATPESFCRATPSHSSTECWKFRTDCVEDFLTVSGEDRRGLSSLINDAVSQINKGRHLHTILVNGRLAHYGWSYHPAEPAWLPETDTKLDFSPGAVSLYAFFTYKTYRGRGLYSANLSEILQSAFHHGATKTYIVCEVRNLASRQAICRVGFKPVSLHTKRRFLLWSANKIVPLKDALPEFEAHSTKRSDVC
jgi:CelD/BcsL family acetyltransferase involved in cellulose biosynthesis